MWEKLKHAFAIEDPQKNPPTEKQRKIVDRLCEEIKKRQMTPAAIAFLEMSRPLNYLGAQGLHFLEPIATAIFSRNDYRELAQFLERRDAVDLICQQLEGRESGKETKNPLACDMVSATHQKNQNEA